MQLRSRVSGRTLAAGVVPLHGARRSACLILSIVATTHVPFCRLSGTRCCCQAASVPPHGAPALAMLVPHRVLFLVEWHRLRQKQLLPLCAPPRVVHDQGVTLSGALLRSGCGRLTNAGCGRSGGVCGVAAVAQRWRRLWRQCGVWCGGGGVVTVAAHECCDSGEAQWDCEHVPRRGRMLDTCRGRRFAACSLLNG